MKLDGVDLLPALTGRNDGPPHDTLYWRFNFPPGQPKRYRWAIRRGNWKLVKNDVAPLALYDLSNDIGERQNRIEQQPELAADLEARWKRWNAELRPPAWQGDQPGRPTSRPASK